MLFYFLFCNDTTNIIYLLYNFKPVRKKSNLFSLLSESRRRWNADSLSLSEWTYKGEPKKALASVGETGVARYSE